MLDMLPLSNLDYALRKRSVGTLGSTTMSTSQLGHPLRFLTDGEIQSATSILLRHVQEEGGSEQAKIHFKNISLHEPQKQFLFPYLESEAKGVHPDQRPYVPRCVDIIWSIDNGRKVTESTVSLDSKTVVGQSHAKKGQHGPNDRYAYEVSPASQCH